MILQFRNYIWTNLLVLKQPFASHNGNSTPFLVISNCSNVALHKFTALIVVLTTNYI